VDEWFVVFFWSGPIGLGVFFAGLGVLFWGISKSRASDRESGPDRKKGRSGGGE